MFNLNDFWKIFKYIYQNTNNNGNEIELQDNVKAIALSEYSKSQLLFEETLDQISFSSQDYRKIRSFLINWYAANRTLTKLQQDSSELFFMTDENLDELFKSFGFNYSYGIREFETKVNFFLDLVNLYKIKGTPASIKRALSYYGLRDIVLIEYFLQLDENNNLKFEPKPILDRQYQTNLNLRPLYFKDLTNLDSHWFQSADDIHTLLQQNKIGLPSKTPYFGIRPSYQFKSIEPVLIYFSNIIFNNIKDFVDNGTIQERDIFIEELNFSVSITELYLASVYCFNEAYGYSSSLDLRYVTNNTGIIDSYDDFKDEYNKIYLDPDSRQDRQDRIDWFKNNFTRLLSDSYIKDSNDSLDLLETMNNDLYDEIIVWRQAGRLQEITPYLIQSLNTWLEENIDISFPDLTILTLGFEGLLESRNIIDFFKPKRSRFLALDVLYEFDNRVFDSIKVEDNFSVDSIIQEFRIYGRPGQPSCGFGHQGMIYDCGYSYDGGLVSEYLFNYLYYDFEDSLRKDSNCDVNFDPFYQPEDAENIEDVTVTGATFNFHNFDTDDFTYDERGDCNQEIVSIEVQNI